jgi:hypothetical protein
VKKLLLVVLLGACPRARPAPAPAPSVAHAVPPEIQWADGGVDANAD